MTILTTSNPIGSNDWFKELYLRIDEFADDLENLAVEYVDMDPELAHEIEAAWYIAYRGPLTDCNLPRFDCNARPIRWRNA